MNRRIAGAHLGKDFLGRNASIHDPDPPGFAVLVLDLLQKSPQRGALRGVARQHLVSQRKALRGDHQGDDHLYAIRALVSRVAELTLVALRERRIAFKICARQIVEQDVELRPEKVLPPLSQKTEELALVFQEPIQAPVEGVFSRNREVL